MEKLRCSNCRGMKKVAKLGGMMGDCNLCRGTGEIHAIKPVVVKMESLPMVNAIIEATAQALPTQIEEINLIHGQGIKTITIDEIPQHNHVFSPSGNTVVNDPIVRIDPKKAKFRKKSKG